MHLDKEGAEAVDFPSYRIGAQVHDHEARIRLLERDVLDLLKDFDEIKTSIKEMQTSLEYYSKRMEEQMVSVSDKIRLELTKHENAEMANQNKIMRYLFGIIISAIGGVSLLLLQHLLKLV